MQEFFTTNELAEVLGVEPWRVRRVFEDGTIADPGRFGGMRTIPKTLIPAVVDALRQRGWLPGASIVCANTREGQDDEHRKQTS